jgi:acetolactate decarboxylase
VNRPRAHLAISTAIAAVTAFLLTTGPAPADPTGARLQQVGTYDYLTQPDFRGLATVGSIATDTTMGLGTFVNLDGELVMVGGEVYRVRPDGNPRLVADNTATPFMQAIRFRPTVNAPIPPGTHCSDLVPLIQRHSDQANGIVAVRVRGTFSALTTRSITADPPPYQPISQTISEQTTFDLAGAPAVLVGFWQGKNALGVGQDGLHLHGLTADKRAGGHVLSCTAKGDVQLSLQPVAAVDLLTPAN